MGTLQWRRNRVNGNATTSPFQTNVDMATIAVGETVVRSIVTFDYWVDSNTTEFIDVQHQINYGISYAPSSTAPLIFPWSSYASTSPRWIYWDQLETRPIEIFDVAGTIYYLVKNGEGSRYIDTRTQWKNTNPTAEHLWFSIEPDPTSFAGWSDSYWCVSSSILVDMP